MVIPSSKRMWLGSATLASLLLASSLTAAASSQTVTATTITRSSMKSVLVASSIVPSGTYTEAIRKQLQWISNPVIATVKLETDATVEKPMPTLNDSVTVAAEQPAIVAAEQPAKVVAAQPAKVAAKQPTKVVAAQPAKAVAEPAKAATAQPVQVAASPKQQVSRSDSSSLINNALSLIGVPYFYGGTSRSGFDCSGFTQYVFKESGISLPRTTAGQFTVGSSISRDILQTGDLVFFTTYAAGASHVGIYIGGGSFVHASNSGVRTTSLSDSYYAGRYLGARRV